MRPLKIYFDGIVIQAWITDDTIPSTGAGRHQQLHWPTTGITGARGASSSGSSFGGSLARSAAYRVPHEGVGVPAAAAAARQRQSMSMSASPALEGVNEAAAGVCAEVIPGVMAHVASRTKGGWSRAVLKMQDTLVFAVAPFAGPLPSPRHLLPPSTNGCYAYAVRLLALSLFLHLHAHKRWGCVRAKKVPILSDNYAYLLIDPVTKKAACVDPAEPEKVRAIRPGPPV